MIAVLKQLFGGTESEQPPEPGIERLALEEIDGQIQAVADRQSRLEAQRQELSSELDQLAAQRRQLLPSLANADAQTARQALDDLAERRRRVEMAGADLADAIAVCQDELKMLHEQRAVAARLHDEAQLREAAVGLAALGAELDVLFAQAAAALERFITDDLHANQLALRLREPLGRHTADRVISALAHYLLPPMSRFGTSFELSTSDERRHLGFDAAATRPFSPRPEPDRPAETADVVVDGRPGE
jgi:hypothetical protein